MKKYLDEVVLFVEYILKRGKELRSTFSRSDFLPCVCLLNISQVLFDVPNFNPEHESLHIFEMQPFKPENMIIWYMGYNIRL